MRKAGIIRGILLWSLLLLLSGCSGTTLGSDVEGLLRAPPLSGETGAVQKALNSYLGVSATLKYPASGDFLSPFLFGDWDGDGVQEAAVLYTSDTAGSNVCLAVLESRTGGWQVAQTAEGLAGEVESVSYAHLWDVDSLQILVGYGSAQGDSYLVVYQYLDGTLSAILKQNYTDMVVTDITGHTEQGIQDLVLTVPSEGENGGFNLQLLTSVDGEFRSAQTLGIGEGYAGGCAGLYAGSNKGEPYLVVDVWTSGAANNLASVIILYNAETGFLQTYLPASVSDVADLYRITRRYDSALVSQDIDGNGTIDIPTEVTNGGVLTSPMDKQLHFLLWRDFSGTESASAQFGLYDGEHRFFLALPDSMQGNIQLRSNASNTGWLLCSRDGVTVYWELRVVPLSDESEGYQRIAIIGSQQLQARSAEKYPGLTLEDIIKNLRLLPQ